MPASGAMQAFTVDPIALSLSAPFGFCTAAVACARVGVFEILLALVGLATTAPGRRRLTDQHMPAAVAQRDHVF